jgi:hypothetical protein
VIKFRERLSANEQRPNRFHMERFNLKKLTEVAGNKQYLVEVSSTFIDFQDLNALEESNNA